MDMDKPQPLKQLWAELALMRELAANSNDPEREHDEADSHLVGMLFVLSDLVKDEFRDEVYGWAEEFADAYDSIEKWYA